MKPTSICFLLKKKHISNELPKLHMEASLTAILSKVFRNFNIIYDVLEIWPSVDISS